MNIYIDIDIYMKSIFIVYVLYIVTFLHLTNNDDFAQEF